MGVYGLSFEGDGPEREDDGMGMQILEQGLKLMVDYQIILRYGLGRYAHCPHCYLLWCWSPFCI